MSRPVVCALLVALSSGCRLVAGYSGFVVSDDETDASAPSGGTGGRDGGDAAYTGGGDAAYTGGGDAGSNDAAQTDTSVSDVALGDTATLGPNPDVTAWPNPDASEVGPELDATVVLDAATDARSDASDGAPRSDKDASDGALTLVDAGECEPPWAGTGVVVSAGFESGAEAGVGWTRVYGGTFGVSSTYAHCGTFSGQETGRTAYYHTLGYSVAIREGSTFSYSVWVLQDGTSDISLAVQWYSDASSCPSAYGPVTYQTVHPKVWTRLSGSMVITSGCTTSTVWVAQSDPGSAVTTFPDLYVDDMYLAQ